MTATGTKFKARASLLDRLIDDDPAATRETRPLRTQTREALMASLRRDLGWLLNTRTALPAARFDKKKLTAPDYGIPDFGGYSPANKMHLRILARRIRKAIAAFEPRLRAVRVQVKPKMPNERSLELIIKAILTVDEFREPVSFVTLFQLETEQMAIHDN